MSFGRPLRGPIGFLRCPSLTGSFDIDPRADGRLCRDRLSIEPDVFHSCAAEDAVYHDRETLDIWLPACCAPIIKDDRPGAVLGQLSFDLPYQLLALYRIGYGGLPFDQLVHLGITVSIIVS